MHSEQTLTFKKIMGHLHTVRTHRKWVRHYCFLAGIKWRGIKHDLSKYSPTEFFESAKYWNGTSSPITRAKEDLGISYAWLHHKGRNTHHYEYWMDDFDKGGIARLMPEKDFTEMVCDMLGASAAYVGTKDGRLFHNCKKYWDDHVKRGCAMNKQNKIMMDIILNDLEYAEAYHKLNPYITSPIDLIKKHHIQEVWRANSNV